jgi:NAD(P)-dependent dehydrogenase (short-subunit alcohol dehydrogenase family)
MHRNPILSGLTSKKGCLLEQTGNPMMMFSELFLKGKCVLITGGGTGLGKAMAIRCAEHGADVAITGRRKEVLEDAATEIRRFGNRVGTYANDVRDYDQVKKTVDVVMADFGRIDALVNNAAGNFICPAEELSVNGWNSVVNIVLNGTFHYSSVVGKRMIEQRAGNIVNIVTTYAWGSEPGVIHSASAKAGVLGMTRTLAAEWARFGIRVNAIAPGAIHTEGTDRNLWGDETQRARMEKRIPLRRFGKPDDVAYTLLFLLSNYADYITGEVITVDGGAWIGKGTYEMIDVTQY